MITFLASYRNQTLNADYANGSPTATLAASRDATHPATYFDASGVMQKTETSNVGRFNYGYYDTTGWHKWSDGDCGVMLEGASTNYLKQGIFAAGTGTATNWTITEDDTNNDTPSLVDVSSDFNIGTTVQSQMIVMTFSGDGSELTLKSDATAAASFAQNDIITVSVWVKGTITGLTLKLRFDEFDSSAVVGSSHAGSDIASSISSTAWRKFTYTATCADADCDNVKAIFEVAGIGAADAIDLQFTCAQLEKLRHVSSFIPTTSAALTRNAETLKYETSGNRTAAVESMVLKFAPEFAKTGSSNYPYIVSSDTKSREIYFDPISGDAFNVYSNRTDSGNSKVNTLGSPAWLANAELTLGYNMQHSSPYIACFWDGVADGSDETVDDFTSPDWGTYFWIGVKHDGNYPFFGTLKSISFFNEVLSDSDMLHYHTDDWHVARMTPNNGYWGSSGV